LCHSRNIRTPLAFAQDARAASSVLRRLALEVAPTAEGVEPRSRSAKVPPMSSIVGVRLIR
jgi:hypothetical protein